MVNGKDTRCLTNFALKQKGYTDAEISWANITMYQCNLAGMTLEEGILFKREWDKEVRRINPKAWEGKR